MPLMSAVPALDRAAGRPLYVQLGEVVQHQIQGHTLLPGEALPSEDELRRHFGVARSVVRQALARLVELGLVERTQGRVSIVAPSLTWRRQLQRAGGLSQQHAARGERLVTRLISLRAGAAPQEARAELGTDDTWEIERCRSVDGVPVAFVRNWVPRHLFPELRADALGEGASLHDLMRTAGHPPYGGRRHVQAVPADEYLADVLRVAVADPLLLLAGTTRDLQGNGLEWFNVWHPGDTVFDVDATVRPEGPPGPDDLARLRETAQVLGAQVAALAEQLDGLAGRRR